MEEKYDYFIRGMEWGFLLTVFGSIALGYLLDWIVGDDEIS